MTFRKTRSVVSKEDQNRKRILSRWSSTEIVLLHANLELVCKTSYIFNTVNVYKDTTNNREFRPVIFRDIGHYDRNPIIPILPD
jgi:hypothetical protein